MADEAANLDCHWTKLHNGDEKYSLAAKDHPRDYHKDMWLDSVEEDKLQCDYPKFERRPAASDHYRDHKLRGDLGP